MRQTKQRAVTPVVAPPALKRRELSHLQALIADEVAEMLVHGGHQEDIENLVWAALMNMNQRTYDWLRLDDRTPEQIRESVAQTSRSAFPQFTAELRMEWKRNERARPEEKTEPKTAAERIRAEVMDQLRDEFERFLINGTPEEHRLLCDILNTHYSTSTGRGTLDELPLGQAFEYAIGTASGRFVRVPPRIEEQVRNYIECLKAADAERCKKLAA